MYEISDFGKILEYGWICPKCGKVMSPIVTVCIYCNGVNSLIMQNKQYIDIDYTKTISTTETKDTELGLETVKTIKHE